MTNTPKQDQKQQQMLGDNISESNISMKASFPVRLYEMLEEAGTKKFDHIISWLPSGTAFRIHHPQEFAKSIMPTYFRQQTRYKSFSRQLNLYEFKFIRDENCNPSNDMSNIGGYFHPHFIRGDKLQCRFISRKKKSKMQGITSHHDQPAAISVSPSYTYAPTYYNPEEAAATTANTTDTGVPEPIFPSYYNYYEYDNKNSLYFPEKQQGSYYFRASTSSYMSMDDKDAVPPPYYDNSTTMMFGGNNPFMMTEDEDEIQELLPAEDFHDPYLFFFQQQEEGKEDQQLRMNNESDNNARIMKPQEIFQPLSHNIPSEPSSISLSRSTANTTMKMVTISTTSSTTNCDSNVSVISDDDEDADTTSFGPEIFDPRDTPFLMTPPPAAQEEAVNKPAGAHKDVVITTTTAKKTTTMEQDFQHHHGQQHRTGVVPPYNDGVGEDSSSSPYSPSFLSWYHEEPDSLAVW